MKLRTFHSQAHSWLIMVAYFLLDAINLYFLPCLLQFENGIRTRILRQSWSPYQESSFIQWEPTWRRALKTTENPWASVSPLRGLSLSMHWLYLQGSTVLFLKWTKKRNHNNWPRKHIYSFLRTLLSEIMSLLSLLRTRIYFNLKYNFLSKMFGGSTLCCIGLGF